MSQTNSTRPWDRRSAETLKSHTAFLAYVALGASRSVREAARQHHTKATAAGEISGRERTTVRTWIGWSSRHKWVSRANARDAWIARASDEQIVVNKLACDLAPVPLAILVDDVREQRHEHDQVHHGVVSFVGFPLPGLATGLSSISPVAILATVTAHPITSAGRCCPSGPFGICAFLIP